MNLNTATHELFARQHGVASVTQLLGTGLTHRQVLRLEHAGAIVGVLRGTYRSPSVDLDELGRCAAACLSRPDLSIAGPTAGRIWGFRRLPNDRRIHVLAPPASNPARAAWVVPYRTSAYHADDIVDRPDGIRLTTRARTAFDLARWLGDDDLLSVIEQAMRDGRLDDDAMRSVGIDWLSSQRRWVTRFLLQMDRRLPGDAAESHPEVRVGDALIRAGVHGVVRQFRIVLPGFGPARFDLALPELRWAIEIDGHPRHEETAGRASDDQRDLAAHELGWDVSRISRTSYERCFVSTVDALVEQYRSRRHLRSMSQTRGRRAKQPPLGSFAHRLSRCGRRLRGRAGISMMSGKSSGLRCTRRARG